MSYFPMYVQLQNRPCLVVGGGEIAWHKAQILKEFGAELTMVAPFFDRRIQNLEGIEMICREFDEADIKGMDIVVAATDNHECNHHISQLCRNLRIPVNAVDQPEDCDFIFPSYVKEGPVVASVSSGGNSPLITQLIRDEIRKSVTEEVGRMAQLLGSIRPRVKEEIFLIEKRRYVYQEILHLGLSRHQIPSEKEIDEVIHKYKKG